MRYLGAVLLAGCALACSGGDHATAPPRTAPDSVGTPPPSTITNIHPVSGLPTPPPLGVTLPAPTPVSPPPNPVPVTPTSITVSDSDVIAPPASLISAIGAAFGSPSPATLLLGHLTGYTSNGLVVTPEPLLGLDSANTSDFTATAPGQAVASPQTVVLSPKTVDAVPGGFGSLRVGDDVLLLVDFSHASPTAIYASDLSVDTAQTTVAQSNRIAPPPPQARPRASRRAAPRFATGAGNFLLEGKGGLLPNELWQDLPVSGLSPAPLPFGTVTFTFDAILGWGERAEYPLAIAQVVGPYVAGDAQTLPLAIENETNGSATYSIDYYAALNVKACLTFDASTFTALRNVLGNAIQQTNCQSLSQIAGPAQSNGQRIFPGYGFQTSTALPLPTPGLHSQLTVIRQPTAISVDLAAIVLAIVSKVDTLEGSAIAQVLKAHNFKFPMQLSSRIDGAVNGGQLPVNLTITNATPSSGATMFTPDLLPGSTFQVTPDIGAGSIAPTNTVTITAGHPIFTGNRVATLDLTVQLPVGSPSDFQLFTFPDSLSAFNHATFTKGPAPISLLPTEAPAQLCWQTQGIATSGGFNEWSGCVGNGFNNHLALKACLRTGSDPTFCTTSSFTVTFTKEQYADTATVYNPCPTLISISPSSLTGPTTTVTLSGINGPTSGGTCLGYFTIPGLGGGQLQLLIDVPEQTP
jgi:hypothetical protein